MAQLPWMWIALAYLVAAIPVGLLIGLAKGVDLREIGSGNIGTTNAMRAMGKAWGSLVLILDVAKAACPVWFARELGEVNEPHALAAVAFAAVCGHIFPVYLRFRGGKGVACALGTLLVLAWPAALCALVVYVVVLAKSRVSALGSLCGVGAGAIWLCYFEHPTPYRVFVFALATLILWRHRENLKALGEQRTQARRESPKA